MRMESTRQARADCDKISASLGTYMAHSSQHLPLHGFKAPTHIRPLLHICLRNLVQKLPHTVRLLI